VSPRVPPIGDMAVKNPVMKRRILCILQLPPPVHGAALMGLAIRNSERLREAFDWEFVNVSASRRVSEAGRWTVRKLPAFLSTLGRVLVKLCRSRYDLCYIALTANGRAFHRDCLLAGLIRRAGVRVVYHLHTKGVSTGQRRRLDDWLYRRLFRDSSVILLSRRLYADVQKYVAPEHVHYCPNGIPPAPRDLVPVRDAHARAEILFLSNLMESKGVFVLLEACRELQARGQAFRCRFVGAPGDVTGDRLLRQIHAQGLAAHASYEGAKYGRDKYLALSRADIFVLPTYYHYECFPLVLLEAMQFALPVVSTCEGGIPDIVEDGRTGYLCPPQDAPALADRLEALLRDKSLRRRMGAAGYQKYQNEFTLETFEKRLADIISVLAEAGVSRSAAATATTG
jgi:glycosyltransferase involved in cell wall biosynthesis